MRPLYSPKAASTPACKLSHLVLHVFYRSFTRFFFFFSAKESNSLTLRVTFMYICNLLGEFLKNLQSSIRISSAFQSSPVSAHASVSLWHMQSILNIFKAKFVFNLVATPFFLPTMNDASSETNAFKFDISILSSWNFSVIQGTIASALGGEFSENSKIFEQSIKTVSTFSLLQS